MIDTKNASTKERSSSWETIISNKYRNKTAPYNKIIYSPIQDKSIQNVAMKICSSYHLKALIPLTFGMVWFFFPFFSRFIFFLCVCVFLGCVGRWGVNLK